MSAETCVKTINVCTDCLREKFGGREHSFAEPSGSAYRGCEIIERWGKEFKPCGAPAVAKADVVGDVCEHHSILALIAGFKPMRFETPNEKL